ncbi:hypothetical protein CDD81_2857 [Ophiocordyceps australis]|uniref:Nucleolar complex-associated protein 3 n=1 Tax=Ophiocordyceps australis TaxID=1399860 RepID=A0A2C5X7F2_9HYPO|nr:hypothetical protein CDD81_2857 [Ophiocordyceps australis]
MATNGTKRRKLAHHSSDDETPMSSKDSRKAFYKNAASWNLEQDYESRPRKGRKNTKESTRLPQIKTANGRLEVLQNVESDDDGLSEASDGEWLDEAQEEQPEQSPEPQIPEAQQIVQAQEELARLAMSINENPEENVGALRSMAKFGWSKVPTIQMLAFMAQMAVFKDIIPGYRIRPQTEEATKDKLSKEVRSTRQYEQSLVSAYQAYVKSLGRCAKLEAGPVKNGQTLAGVAVTCACSLLTAVSHFNFRIDLINILVGKLSSRRTDDDTAKCLQAFETLFRDDQEGRPSFESVSVLSKMMKARKFQVDEGVVNLFLSLRLLNEFSGKASHQHVDQADSHQQAAARLKGKKKDREFRTKRQRKERKEQKSLEKDMANADALVSHEERERMQSETLKLVFATYFRILKLRCPHLMGAVLEGLAKYAHLINQDFFGDILEALKDLIRYSDSDARDLDEPSDAHVEAEHPQDDADNDSLGPVRNLTREALLCTVTAFALLAGQDAHNSRHHLHLDLSFFTTHLFRSLLTLSTSPDLENTLLRPFNKTTSASASKVNVQTSTVLLLRSLTSILLPHYNVRQVAPLRLAAFTKQLMTVALQLPEKSCQAVLGLLSDVAHTHGPKVRSLWNTEERKANGTFCPLAETAENSNPFTATVWEGELLRKHFSPKVRESAELLEKTMSG